MNDLRLIRFSYAEQRDKFTLPEDTYEHWVLLAAHSGKFKYIIEAEEPIEGTAQFGDIIICPPGCTLKREAIQPIAFLFAEFALESELINAGKTRVHDIGRLNSTYDYLQQVQAVMMDGQSRSLAEHLIRDMIMQIALQEHSSANPQRVAAHDPTMAEIAAYIEKQACEGELSMQQLAASLGISASQLTRRFQAAYKISPVRYATRVRLTKATRLLAETQLNLEHIAESCGFQNAFYLSRVFSQHMQQSPSAYRRASRV